MVVQLHRHNSDFDGIGRLVAQKVSLNEGGNIPEAEPEAGGVGEDEIAPLVAPHRQV